MQCIMQSQGPICRTLLYIYIGMLVVCIQRSWVADPVVVVAIFDLLALSFMPKKCCTCCMGCTTHERRTTGSGHSIRPADDIADYWPLIVAGRMFTSHVNAVEYMCKIECMVPTWPSLVIIVLVHINILFYTWWLSGIYLYCMVHV